MSERENDVRKEVEDLHRFFVGWFNGTVDEADLESVFVSRLDEHVLFISPDGNRMGRDGLVGMFRRAHGANPEFRIEIRDVRVLRDLGDHLLVTYSEWQKRARSSAKPDNARFTSVLLTKKQPFKWLHIHETWLPEAEMAADPYDF